MPSSISIIAAASALYGAAVVSAHGHVTGATTPDGTFHQGWSIDAGHGFGDNFPDTVGWTTDVRDNGFVTKDSYATPDIICHLGATNAAKSIEIAAGDVLTLTWNTWPTSHHGPVMDYLASCGADGCTTVDKEGLEFFKISEVGNIVPGFGDNGLWGADLIIQNNMQWQVQIPSNIAAGEYVLRHEILALHQLGEPQNYPQCLNLIVTGGGSDVPEGTIGTDLYTDYEDFNIYTDFDTYPIPGPALIDGANPIVDQGSEVPVSDDEEEEEEVETTTQATTTTASTTSASTTSTAAATTTAASNDECVIVEEVVTVKRAAKNNKRVHARALKSLK